MRLAKIILLSAVLSGCSDKGPWSGPFGTKKGLSREKIEEFSVLSEMGRNGNHVTYTSPQAPDMSFHSDEYVYVIGDSDGLCAVSANFSGDRLYNYIASLVSKYGKPSDSDDAGHRVNWSSESHRLDSGIRSFSVDFYGEESRKSAWVRVSYADECN